MGSLLFNRRMSQQQKLSSIAVSQKLERNSYGQDDIFERIHRHFNPYETSLQYVDKLQQITNK